MLVEGTQKAALLGATPGLVWDSFDRRVACTQHQDASTAPSVETHISANNYRRSMRVPMIAPNSSIFWSARQQATEHVNAGLLRGALVSARAAHGGILDLQACSDRGHRWPKAHTGQFG